MTENEQEIIVKIYNQHSPDCGFPPLTTNRDHPYLGYFANEHGEQWIFVYDDATRKAVLWGGDAGWENRYEFSPDDELPVVLGPNEQTWLAACWMAATTFERS